MELIDIVLRISVVFMIIMIPASIIQLAISICLHNTGFRVSVFEAIEILVCTVGWWVMYLKMKSLSREPKGL